MPVRRHAFRVRVISYSRQTTSVRTLDPAAIEVGVRAAFRHTITQSDVDAFARLTGDFNPLHVDAAFARRTHFARPVVHGMLSASFISTMIGTILPGAGALWTSQTLDFLAPAFVDDELNVEATVVAKSVATRVVTLSIVVSNQHGQELVTGRSTVKMLEPRSDEPSELLSHRARVVLVTGAGKGIGAAIASALAHAGHAVAVNYRHSENAANALVAELRGAGLRAAAIQADVSEAGDVAHLFAQAEAAFGDVTDLVHCAAPLPIPRPFDELTWDRYLDQMQTQVGGAFNCVKAALPSMIERRDGSFVFIGSIFTDGVPPVNQSPYIAAKAALVSFARSLAVEYGPKGIRVNVIAPGMTETDMIANLPEKAKVLAKMQTPLRRLGTARDIANVAQFLISPAARHITGETIRVCGGISMA